MKSKVYCTKERQREEEGTGVNRDSTFKTHRPRQTECAADTGKDTGQDALTSEPGRFTALWAAKF